MGRKSLSDLYETDEYLGTHPSLHEEDSPWKVTKIIPMVDAFIENQRDKREINILDVGGGAGLILNSVSSYIQEQYGIKVNKLALDLSPGMLRIQKANNPDLNRLLNEDISEVSLKDKEIDLALMIDVIEHVTKPKKALKQLKRVSKFIIFKVPLDDNIYSNVRNFLNGGKYTAEYREISGHVNIYNLGKLRNQIEVNTGVILSCHFTDAFSYVLNSAFYSRKMNLWHRIGYSTASCFYRLSPQLCSRLFGGSVVILVRAEYIGNCS